jgi:hypothetical protein
MAFFKLLSLYLLDTLRETSSRSSSVSIVSDYRLDDRGSFLRERQKDFSSSHSILDTVGIHVPTRQIRESSTFSVSSALKRSPSARYVIAANDVCRFFDIFHKKQFLL